MDLSRASLQHFSTNERRQSKTVVDWTISEGKEQVSNTLSFQLSLLAGSFEPFTSMSLLNRGVIMMATWCPKAIDTTCRSVTQSYICSRLVNVDEKLVWATTSLNQFTPSKIDFLDFNFQRAENWQIAEISYQVFSGFRRIVILLLSVSEASRKFLKWTKGEGEICPCDQSLFFSVFIRSLVGGMYPYIFV